VGPKTTGLESNMHNDPWLVRTIKTFLELLFVESSPRDKRIDGFI
jgi:hypothetical protein